MKIRDIIIDLQSENIKLKKEVDTLKSENKKLKFRLNQRILDQIISVQKLIEEVESTKKNFKIPVPDCENDLNEENLVFDQEDVEYENDQVIVDNDDSDFGYDNQSKEEVLVENKRSKRRKKNIKYE